MIYRTLVEAQELLNHLGDPSWVIVDCRFSLADISLGKQMYLAGHIPGACFADVEHDLSSPIGPKTGRHPLPNPKELAAKLGAWGVSSDSQVVAYDEAQGMFAARLWWLLRWLGHEAVAVLNGGYAKWTASGFQTTKEVPPSSKKVFAAKQDDSKWVSTEFIASHLGKKEVVLVDARAPERYRGEVEPIDAVAGHIPGALNVPFAGNVDEKGAFRPAETLRERFVQQMGKASPKNVVNMCGSGVTACHNVLAMEIAGLPDSRLYAGSWSEWIRTASHPIAK